MCCVERSIQHLRQLCCCQAGDSRLCDSRLGSGVTAVVGLCAARPFQRAGTRTRGRIQIVGCTDIQNSERFPVGRRPPGYSIVG
jgi:hypothetical protein